MDKNGNGLIEMAEFEAAGWEGLPLFKGLGADGHHYDVESGTLPNHSLKACTKLFSEFFLHHEEVFHSTPETQTE